MWASYRGKRLTLAERGHVEEINVLKINNDDDDNSLMDLRML